MTTGERESYLAATINMPSPGFSSSTLTFHPSQCERSNRKNHAGHASCGLVLGVYQEDVLLALLIASGKMSSSIDSSGRTFVHGICG
jgi:hypothetical protein